MHRDGAEEGGRGGGERVVHQSLLLSLTFCPGGGGGKLTRGVGGRRGPAHLEERGYVVLIGVILPLDRRGRRGRRSSRV